ncbi:dihydroorotate oxidase B catalytic subunit /dihydrouracil dehydrogenase (NAD+) /dihydropyrimidine dehydrogenase (NADP+) [Mucilaginibacter gracilis]|uniref:dihydrouracil dehydrogenase (NAD(+)) n=1 Tax=Mucilaginibacter gracilis TaxID=423350 RepID=A0A495J463_9SPHI|nr:NAD-dependent dihydropyrimidine dehydrogenase subunit PreA [Mucilaginibacter gracilis]RKR83770.1 dihydroorotate oxidase B catalytic subunit /dihydrouracil dehydrogenase (NAD+) /dihydropyrimidine dehydrogenase (NADP+) [Mucilaginibacter gracilis]
MADISSNFLGIKSPNPFWLASAPPTDKKINVLRAFEAGWGGVVWKTLGTQVKNVSSRYSAVDYHGSRVMGFNNIELISDRPLDINLIEIKEVLKEFPDRAMVVSLMADNDRESWHELIKKVQDTGAHGLELNFGCPHGMTERGMGAAVGQDPEIARMVVEWVMEIATIPVITKLTPNVHSVVPTGLASVLGGTNALSLINTIQSVTGIDLDTLIPNPNVGGKSAFGGYCGPAVKPIALKFLTTIAQNEITRKVPVSGIGGISTWKDAVEFMLLGASNVQVCTAAMKHGFRIVEDMIEGLNYWMDDKGFKTLNDFIGKSVHTMSNWEDLDINYHVIANINQDKCVHCGLCYIACEDTSHQSITLDYGKPYNKYTIKEEECVGCNLCNLVCPVDDCITMVEHRKADEYMNWKDFQRLGLPLNDH